MSTGDTERPMDDATLLAAIGRLWQQVDPPPADLVHGVLARIAAEDLEFDLLTLVESQDALAGVRSAAETDDVLQREESGSWSLEYAGSDFRVYLRLNRIDDRTRADGWVVPARPLTVRLLAEDRDVPLETSVDEFGRFDFADAPAGLARLLFLDESPTADRPRITPPFWI
ncbi:MAG: hypothetical protein ABWX73_03720 [Marmoricola sp.]